MRTPVFATRPEDLPAAARIAAMSGLDIMRAMLAGDLPHPPIARVMAIAWRPSNRAGWFSGGCRNSIT
jgi:hypothetical protein